jgi:hypothetical protein
VKKILLLLLLLAARFCSADPYTNLISHLEPVPPFPDVQKAAVAAHIPLDGMTPANNAGTLAPGNSITALITLHQKGNRRTQWLVYFEVVAGTNSAKAEKPMVVYNSMSNKFEFARSPAAFSIRTLGPYVDTRSVWGNPVPRDKYGRASIDGSFLGLGLDKGAATIYRINQVKQKNESTNFDLFVSPKPPTAEKAGRNRKFAAELKITPNEELALAAWYPAISSYFNSVGETPNLDTILLKVLNFPSLWSIVKHGGIDAGLAFEMRYVRPITLPAQWNLPTNAPVYTLPMSVRLNDQPAINATLLITSPRPPLLGCGGIVGFIAENPVDSQNYMTLQVISTR